MILHIFGKFFLAQYIHSIAILTQNLMLRCGIGVLLLNFCHAAQRKGRILIMKNIKILSVVLALITMTGFAACGGNDGDKTDNGTSKASSAIDTADNATAATVDTTAKTSTDTTVKTSDDTTAAEETKAEETKAEETTAEKDPDKYTAKGKNITITVPKAEGFFDFPNAEFKYSVIESAASDTFTLEITAEGMKSVNEFSVQESVGRKGETLEERMEYRNSLQKDESTKYTMCEIAGYRGILQVKTNESLKTIKHDYYIEVPVDGENYFINYYVSQRFNTDTDEMHNLEETFLKNITVTKN